MLASVSRGVLYTDVIAPMFSILSRHVSCAATLRHLRLDCGFVPKLLSLLFSFSSPLVLFAGWPRRVRGRCWCLWALCPLCPAAIPSTRRPGAAKSHISGVCSDYAPAAVGAMAEEEDPRGWGASAAPTPEPPIPDEVLVQTKAELLTVVPGERSSQISLIQSIQASRNTAEAPRPSSPSSLKVASSFEARRQRPLSRRLIC